MPDAAQRRPRRRLAWLTGVAVLAAVSVPVLGLVEEAYRPVVAGAPPSASAGPSPEVRITPDGTGSSPVTWRVRPTGDRAVDGVVQAYRRYLGTTVRVAEEPDPQDPALPLVAGGERLAELRRFLVAAVDSGSSSRGPVTATATVLETGPAAVALLACTDYSAQRTTVLAGRPLVGGKVAATVGLRRSEGAWRVVSSVRGAVPRCR